MWMERMEPMERAEPPVQAQEKAAALR